ncbi:9289_t:CDS:10, partial [Cetraspora pellucida]
VSNRVASFLNTDSLKLRFATAHPTSDTYETVIIKSVADQTLSEMLQTTYLPSTQNLLYYEILDVNIIELENNMFFKVYWLGTTNKKEEEVEVCIPKNAKIYEVLRVIVQKLALPQISYRIRLYDVLNCKIQNEYNVYDSIDKIQEHLTLYAEEISQDEIELGANDKIIQVFHFTKEPSRVHGIPFKFVLKAGEPFSTTKLRLRLRLGINEEDFLKVKVAIIKSASSAVLWYIEDNDVILSDFGLTDELLGLDYVNKTGRAGRIGVKAIANTTMPNLDYEIEDFQYYTWRITDWKELEKRTTSPEFDAGNWKWRILLFPFGNNNTDCVSIYLEFSDLEEVPDDWYCCVQFALLLWNPYDPSFFVSHHAHHRFTTKESDWGFTRFYDLRKLFVPTANHARSLIEHDACNITALVRIIKDPTGVLWRDLTNYDSKKETGYVGLKDQGIINYLNAELQLLYSIKYFRKAIYQILTEDDEPNKSIPLAMQRIFYQLQVSDTPVETTELTKSFGLDSLDGYMQYDVQEFDRMLLDCLENKMKNTYADGAISKLFSGEMKSYVRCVNVDYETTCIEDYYDIQLEVKGCKTLNDSFLEFIREESCVGNNKYQTETYGLQDARKGVIFESFPPVLRINLNRLEYDTQSDTTVKINGRHEYPMEIDLQEYLSLDSDKSKPHNYLLHGVIVHSGDFHGGSYHIFLKPERSGRWFKFDDDTITPVTDKEVLENSYGDNDPNIAGYITAYSLIYIRESDIDFVLTSVLAEDIPEHLKSRLNEEKTLYEQKKKESEVRHLYLSTKVVTPEIFESHQGFDLANLEDRQYPISEVQQFNVLKSETYRTFKTMVAKKFRIPVEQIRFWILVSRHNKTLRPDTPLTDNFLGMTMEEIHTKFVPRQLYLKLFLEVADKQINGETWFPTIENDPHVLVFIKYFDTDKQSLKGFCYLYVRKHGKVGDIIPFLREKKNFPPGTSLKIYEEIKPNMIESMRPRLTFQQSEIQDGDVICFQKALTEHELQHTAADYICDIPKFYDSLLMCVVVQFKPKYKDREPKSEFELTLNKRNTYDEVAKSVAAFLITDPLKIQFGTAYPATDTYKAIIKSAANQTLLEMLQTTFLPSTQNLLYYEILDINTAELETNMFFKVYWLGTSIMKEEVIAVLLPKTAVINEILKVIVQKLSLPIPTSRIRLYDALHFKIQNEYDIDHPIYKIQEQVTLYAE